MTGVTGMWWQEELVVVGSKRGDLTRSLEESRSGVWSGEQVWGRKNDRVD